MNANAQAQAAYATPSNAHKAPRTIEYELFAQITARLRAAISTEKTAFPALASAMIDNRRLWSELAVDLASPGNGLPDSLRGQLLGIAQFIMTHTDHVMTGDGQADVLVDLNLAIMRGLQGQERNT